MKGGKGETRSRCLFNLMIICVAWSLRSSIPMMFSFHGWVGAGLEGRRSAWAGSSGLAPHAFLSQADTGVVPGWKSLTPGQDPRRASPFSTAFSPCLIPTSAVEAQSPWLMHTPPSLLAKHFPPDRPWAGAGTGQEGHCSPPTGMCQACGPVAFCQREDAAMATFHLSLSKLLRCQWLPGATSLAQAFPSLL